MRGLLAIVAVFMFLAVGIGDAHATYYLSWRQTTVGDTNIKVLYDGGVHHTQAGAYKLRISEDTNYNTYVEQTGFFCLDLQRVANTTYWEANKHVLPPDYQPQNPPPYNIWESGWLLQTYDWSTSADYGAGMQLALWELSHEADFWGTGYNVSTWDSHGLFQLYDGYTAGARNRATFLLEKVRAAGENPPVTSYIEYYEPTPLDPAAYGQGMLREGPPIPEPNTMLLVGTALIAGAGMLRWRRSRQ